MGLIEILSSPLVSGGITGLVGTIGGKFFDLKTKKLEMEAKKDEQAHEVKMREADAAIMREEWAQRTKMAEVEAAGKLAVAETEAFKKTLFLEPERYSDGVKPTIGQGWVLVLMDAFRSIIRPGITIYLSILVTLLYLDVSKTLGAARTEISPEVLHGTLREIIDMILYLTGTCVTWWFGTRTKAK